MKQKREGGSSAIDGEGQWEEDLYREALSPSPFRDRGRARQAVGFLCNARIERVPRDEMTDAPCNTLSILRSSQKKKAKRITFTMNLIHLPSLRERAADRPMKIFPVNRDHSSHFD